MATCPNCGEENPDRARFCLNCATALGDAPSPQAEERKVVTVLFCDLVGFTAASDDADPEDVRARIRPYHARLRTEIERFGGTVEKFIGDAVMAVFGAPVAHEDDAERAVRAGIRIIEAIEELNSGDPGLGLSVRVGINTGEAVVALGARPEQGEGMVAGDVVNTAARIQTIAQAGTVAVGELTYRITRDHIDYEQLGPAEVKGKRQPVPVWRAVAARGRYGVDVELTTGSPFIGRSYELDLLIRTFSRAVDEDSLQLVTITGEPGVGKTRLLWELKQRLDDDPGIFAYWRQGRCLPYGEGVSFWALGEMVKGICGVLESDGPDETGRKVDVALQGFVEDQTEHEWMRARLLPLLGLGATETAASRDEAYAAWRSFLEAVAARHALGLVFEDLHWADPAMLDFVEHLVDWSTGVPLLVICSARPELYERHPDWGGGKRNSTTISLSPLSEEDTARLLSVLLSQAVLPAGMQAALLERAGGNPLYAEEFVRMLMDRGILERRGRTVHIAEGAEIPLPETVQAIIAARLDTLTSRRKSLLQDAAVVGKVFWSGALAFMGTLLEREVQDGLHELARKELVRRARTSSVKDQMECAFWHALVRDVAYAQIPRADRARRHRLAAEWIERSAGERLSDHAEFLAYHYEQALELTRVTGQKDQVQELAGLTRRFLTTAGDRASGLDVKKAVGYYRRALSLEPTGRERAELLAKAANAMWEGGEGSQQEIVRDFEEAIATFRAERDVRGAADALTKLGVVVWADGETERSRALQRQAIELLEAESPSRELAWAYAALGGREMLAGHDEPGLELVAKSMALAEKLAIPEVTQWSLQTRGGIRCAGGDTGGLDDLREALRLGLQLGVGQPTATAYDNLADWTGDYEGPERALAIYQDGIEFAERRGLRAGAMWMRAETTWRLMDLGRWDELLEVADAVLEFGGRSQMSVIVALEKTRVFVLRGQLEAAAVMVERELPRAREIGDPQVYWRALDTAALLAWQRGDLEEARALVEEMARATGHDLLARAFMAVTASRVLVAAGAADEAERFIAGAPARVRSFELKLLSARSLVAEARGDLPAALHRYEEAVAGWSEYGGFFETAMAHLGAGRCLIELGRAIDASEHLGEARRRFAELRARPFVAEADSLLERATALTS